MIPLKEDLTLLLREAGHTSDYELEQKLRSALDKHQPKDEEPEEP
jgi:hypothetical protein